jgi:thiamine biosynthesis lipoprotein
LVSLGGDLSIAGESPKTGWVITVGDTSDLDAAVGTETEQTVIVRAGGLATSSIRARRWRRGGSELHHLIDPRITAPSQGTLRTVSVTASTCTLANTASTAAIILGADAPAWLESRGFPARLVARNGTVRYVGGWPQSEASR